MWFFGYISPFFAYLFIYNESMRRKFKNKRFLSIKKIVFIVLMVFTIYFITGIFFNGKVINLKDILLTNSLKEMTRKDSIITNNLDIDITTPENIILSSFNKLVDRNKIKELINDDYYDYNESKSEYVEDTSDIKIDKPIVYIYNSHQLEEYNLEYLYDYSVKPNVLIASYILKEKLYNNGIPSVVETNNIKKYLNDNNLKYNYSYVASRHFIELMLKKEPTIKYLIDIHRDSAKYSKTLYEKEGKKYARIMFVVGLDHKNYQPNLKLATELNEIIEKEYPGFSRGISKKTGKGVNGIYNQDISPNSMLIEVGGVDNTIEEVNNTMDVLSNILSKYIKENDNGN